MYTLVARRSITERHTGESAAQAGAVFTLHSLLRAAMLTRLGLAVPHDAATACAVDLALRPLQSKSKTLPSDKRPSQRPRAAAKPHGKHSAATRITPAVAA